MKRYSGKGEKEKALLEKVRNTIHRSDTSSEVILYGSRARGDAGAESDYDLIILTNGPITLKREDAFRRELYPIELETGAVFTVILVSRKDWNSTLYASMPFYQNIQKDGVIL